MNPNNFGSVVTQGNSGEVGKPNLPSIIGALSSSYIFKQHENTLKFYKELLLEEKKSTMGLDYWIDYMDMFDVGHKIPLYD